MSAQPNVVSLEQLDQDFRSILESVEQLNLPKADVRRIFAPLRWHIFRRKWIKRLKWCLLIAILSLAVYYIPILNWNASAVGRLVMIQVLPLWDWRPLHNEKCLVKSFFSSNVERHSESNYEISPYFEDCVVCENIESISKHEKVSYDFLYEKHLLRSLPVVITDSHRHWNDRFWDNVTHFMESIEPLLLNSPCNVQTNLILDQGTSQRKSNKYASLLDVLVTSSNNDSWFLHFRNCQLKTVKSTRLLFERPYFYAPHLEMPYTTWLLMSNNYNSKRVKTLKMDGLVIVMQLKESVNVRLVPKGVCYEVCNVLDVELSDGEALLFSTNLWKFQYKPFTANRTAITFITETYVNQ